MNQISGGRSSGLDYTSGGTFADNQYARVDILRASASDLSTSASDIVTTLYGPNVDSIALDTNGNLIPNPYTTYAFDLTSVLRSGQTYRLRFAEVDNLSAINLGVDNLSLTAVVPEPRSVALLASAGVAGGMYGARRRHRT